MIYSLQNTQAQNDYHGCGKAWLAIKDNTPIALRYMGAFEFNRSELPKWCQAVLDSYCIIGELNTQIDCINAFELSKIKKSAIAAGHPAVGPRGGHIKASKIANDAQRLIDDEQHRQFSEYRLASRAELAEKGDVVSGMCSCYEFVVN